MTNFEFFNWQIKKVDKPDWEFSYNVEHHLRETYEHECDAFKHAIDVALTLGKIDRNAYKFIYDMVVNETKFITNALLTEDK